MEQYSFTLVLAVFSSLLLFFHFQTINVLIMFSCGIISWLTTLKLIPQMAVFMKEKKIQGKDINKKGSEKGEKDIPECLGFASSVSFFMVCSLYTLIMKFYLKTDQNIHIASLLTIMVTVLLGFADDMLDLKWRYKLIFPFFIIIPFMISFVGETHISVIYPFNLMFGSTLELGVLYLFYGLLLGIYCTNTINIYAGINGLEVGQSIICASFILVYIAVKGCSSEYGAFLLIVFLGGALALMKFNAYPSQIFIGDTFCYYAGIIIAIVSLLENIPIVIHWFLIPQLINFLYSCPQLFGIYDCPRHRLTQYNKETDLLHGVKQHMNLLNLSLRILGPTNQGKLCFKLLLFQTAFSTIPIIYQICIGTS